MQLSPNTELQSGKYRILRVLGQGGFGITYLAQNTLLERTVAIKEFFPKELCGRDNTSHLTLGTQNNTETVARLRARFLREARNIARLDHPGIVHIHDVFEENNTAYYVMDYIDGENLNEMVKRDGPMPEETAIGYITRVGEALAYIHSRQMTHFDVKPANIMVRRSDNQPVLIDFGLSKQYDASGDATSTLMQAVSHGYSPMEMYIPGRIKEFSPETDVYSLAATLYYLLTAQTPPYASDIQENGLTLPASISAPIATAITNVLTARRIDRTQNIKLFIGSLSTDRNDNKKTESHKDGSISTEEPQPRNLSEDTRILSKETTSNKLPSNPAKIQTECFNFVNKRQKKALIVLCPIVLAIICIGILLLKNFYGTQSSVKTSATDSLKVSESSSINQAERITEDSLCFATEKTNIKSVNTQRPQERHTSNKDYVVIEVDTSSEINDTACVVEPVELIMNDTISIWD